MEGIRTSPWLTGRQIQNTHLRSHKEVQRWKTSKEDPVNLNLPGWLKRSVICSKNPLASVSISVSGWLRWSVRKPCTLGLTAYKDPRGSLRWRHPPTGTCPHSSMLQTCILSSASFWTDLRTWQQPSVWPWHRLPRLSAPHSLLPSNCHPTRMTPPFSLTYSQWSMS